MLGSFSRRFFSSSLLVAMVFVLPSARVLVLAQDKCNMCLDDSDIAHPLEVIPQLQIPGNPNPTCQDAHDYAGIVDASNEDMCNLLQAQAAFCGCGGAVPPLDDEACSLCSNGDDPTFPNRNTPYGDTCSELKAYLSSITTEDCATERGTDLLRNAFGCGCPGAVTDCAMCPDGTIELQYPDKVVPFFSLVAGSANPTCEDLALLSAASDPQSIVCDLVQAQAGFCGCADVNPVNACSFCPDGNPPENVELVTPTTDTCQDLHDYMTFLDDDTCDSLRAKDIQALGFVCGCAGAEPSCTLCLDGSDPPNPDQLVQEGASGGPTCAKMALAVAGLTEDGCDDQRQSIIGISAERCGCPDAQVPPCSVQQNPSMCTEELLDTVPADTECECYSFCDGVFLTCHAYPGGLLGPAQCTGVAVAGCNRQRIDKNDDGEINGTDDEASEAAPGVVGIKEAIFVWMSLLVVMTTMML
jgi:hypothetical protein